MNLTNDRSLRPISLQRIKDVISFFSGAALRLRYLVSIFTIDRLPRDRAMKRAKSRGIIAALCIRGCIVSRLSEVPDNMGVKFIYNYTERFIDVVASVQSASGVFAVDSN